MRTVRTRQASRGKRATRIGQVEHLEERWLPSRAGATMPMARSAAADALPPAGEVTAERASVIAGTTGQQGDAEQRLPDLAVWASAKNGYLYGWHIDTNEPLMPGRKLLRLTNAIVNRGRGPLELRPGSVNAQGKQEVFQRIYDVGGGFTDRLAGTFVYHLQHAHTHFEDFAQYNLRAVTQDNGVGDVVASGTKVSFCLLDVAKVDGAPHGSARKPHYQSCNQFQGISVGWGDVYDGSLADQWIDITDVPDGEYWLESVVDPSNRIVESDETNNVTRILIDLGPPPPDDFPNTFDAAAPLTLSDAGAGTQAGRIERSGDVDVFSFTAPQRGKMKITQAGTGDGIDSVLAAYNSTQQLISQDDDSAGQLDSRIKLRLVAGQVYYVKAAGFGNSVGHYLLTFFTKFR